MQRVRDYLGWKDLSRYAILVLVFSMLITGCGRQMNTNAVEYGASQEDMQSSDSSAEGLFYHFADVKDFVQEYEEDTVNVGIDVSKWQGEIDWQAVADAGVDFAFIRVGYRAANTGIIFEDPYAKYNLQQAEAAGIKVGAYFFSTAVNVEEALEEAAWTCAYIAQYKITYPVAYNCEGFKTAGSRNYGLSNDVRSANAIAFLELVESQGYEGMFYASKSELQSSNYWNTKKIDAQYDIWVSQYPGTLLQENPRTSYNGEYACWQFTYKGVVPGITRSVDLNIAYFTKDIIAQPKDLTPYELVEAPKSTVSYAAMDDIVVAKRDTGLKTEPTANIEVEASVILRKDELVKRIAVGSNGWSMVEYNQEMFYVLTADVEAVSQ
ncbi:MAG: glycoside hydrolase family 25 [Lachnospiraceae bacterium]|nr:glycoside hydrolase family 25 [Lachnospiraceae bacterium]